MVIQSRVGRGWSRGGNKSSLARFKGSENDGRFLKGPAGSAMSKLKEEDGVRKEGEGDVEFGVLGRGAR